MTICKKRLAPLALALLLVFGLTVGAAPVSADAANEHVIEFLDVIGPMASADMQQNGILASLTIAQAMWESTYGQSPLAVNANNLFGIKAYSSWDGMVYCSANGTLYTSYQEAKSILGESFMNTYKEKFWRAYSSWQESVNDHSNLFNTADRYENLRGLTDYKLACQYVVEDGYCSDPDYAENLIGLIEDYELYRYDVGDVDPGEVTRVALSESNITLRVGQSFSLEASVYPTTAADKSVTWSSSDTSVATVSGGLVSAKKLGAANITATSKNGKTATCTVLVADDSGSLTLDKTALTLALGGVGSLTVTGSMPEDIRTGVMTGDVYIRAAAANSTAGHSGIAKAGVEVKIFGEAIGNFYYIECLNDSGKLVRGYVYTTKVKITGDASDGANSSVTWTSSNTSVATVRGGQVFAFGVGSAVITASSGESSVSCVVTVADTAAHYNAIITQNVNLRRWLSTSAESNGIADAGTEVTVIGSVVTGDGDRFYFTICENTRAGGKASGYVLEECLKLGTVIKPAPPTGSGELTLASGSGCEISADGYLLGVADGSSVEQVLGLFTNTGLRVLDASGAVLEAGAVVGTGCVVELLVNGAKVDSCVVVVAGDVNGDGRITASDYILVKREILVGEGALTGAYYEAAKLNGGSLTASTYLLLKRQVLGLD